VIFALLACSPPEDAPSCVLDDQHTCGPEIMQACNDMLVMSGLTVTFDGAAPVVYDARVTVDGTETVFACGKDGVTASVGTVWWCNEQGFFLDVHGDVVDVEVAADGETWTGTFEPCWEASEPNGRCCGWHYSAEVQLELE
jgi:hypothetical protein